MPFGFLYACERNSSWLIVNPQELHGEAETDVSPGQVFTPKFEDWGWFQIRRRLFTFDIVFW